MQNSRGALPAQTIREMMEAGFIKGSQPENIKPASLDLTISSEIYSVNHVFQPRMGETVRSLLEKTPKNKHSLKNPFLSGKIYIARLNEKLKLPKQVYGYCNPKSTSGRIDTHVRLMADGVPRYDAVTPSGWSGELWVSIIPKLFPILMHENQSLNQLRFFNGDARLNELELEIAIQKYKLIWNQKNKTNYSYEDIAIRDGDGSIILTLDINGKNIGYEGVLSDKAIDLGKISHYDSKNFFQPLKKNKDHIFLKRDHFYILSTLEAVRVPPNLACEMVPMDERSGEFRSHYAGFIDCGWGWGKGGEGKGRPLTLEVRPFEDLVIRHGQPIAKIKFEKMSELPEIVYDAISSNYVRQSGPRLAKHFK